MNINIWQISKRMNIQLNGKLRTKSMRIIARTNFGHVTTEVIGSLGYIQIMKQNTQNVHVQWIIRHDYAMNKLSTNSTQHSRLNKKRCTVRMEDDTSSRHDYNTLLAVMT